MVTEPLLHLLLPPRAERRGLKIDNHPLFCRQEQSPSSASASAAKRKQGRKRKRSPQESLQEDALGGERKGWREFIGSGRDEELAREVRPSAFFCLFARCFLLWPSAPLKCGTVGRRAMRILMRI